MSLTQTQLMSISYNSLSEFIITLSAYIILLIYILLYYFSEININFTQRELFLQYKYVTKTTLQQNHLDNIIEK